ncbi:MAG: hypothetical protein B5766_10700 [Candidatus Lumbricidophila eiseniae]|uniref:Integrase catalytic domain-containing protein n=1 Tax=Candidatus Lumbricidiphila eiseniae TaxID=1969409 RepID=A0A2A6FQ30_9MICO|nr:MAG: hypothetical protein B5766_10700 [Candidatus Lumbricidophila eiseniae]
MDEHTRERIGGLVERSLTADRLTDHPEKLVTQHGAPAALRSNNEPEFITEVIADWADTRTGLFYIPPRSPRHNEYIESFNNRLRDQCLNINNFYPLIHTRVLTTDWKSEHNHTRPHSSPGHLTPTEHARQYAHQIETNNSHNLQTQQRGPATPKSTTTTSKGCSTAPAA